MSTQDLWKFFYISFGNADVSFILKVDPLNADQLLKRFCQESSFVPIILKKSQILFWLSIYITLVLKSGVS